MYKISPGEAPALREKGISARLAGGKMSEDIHAKEIQELEKRDWQLWAMTLSLLLALAVFIIVIYFYWNTPGILGEYETGIYLLGFTGLILLFSSYMVFKEVEIKRLKNILVEDRVRIATLQRIGEMKSDFVSMVSHELRNPLTNIKNAVDIIMGEKAGGITEDQKKFLSLATRNINRLVILINELLDLSKIESGKIKVDFKCLDINIPINMVTASLKTRTDEKSLSVYTEVPADLPKVYGDQEKIERIFTNLLDNAVKFTPEGGEIRISARAVRDQESEAGNFIEISVADTGLGIPADDLERVFDKFYQVEKTLSQGYKGGGTGLGLAIAKGIVEAHQGRIWAESRVGKGTTFTFRLLQCDSPKNSDQ